MHPALRHAADQQLGLFTAAQAIRAGYDRSEIRRHCAAGRWTRLRRGVYVIPADLAGLDRGARHRLDCLAVLLSLGRRSAAVSHTSAARLWELPVRRDLPRTVRLTDPGPWRRGRDYLMAEAPLREAEVTTVGPLRLTSPTRTVLDCAREWPLEPAVVAMDAALLAGLTTPGLLRGGLEAMDRWPGVARATRAVALADGRAESPLETRGRLRIVGAGLPTPQLQVEIRARGRLVAVVDAWFDDAAVAVEFDGRIKYTDPWRDPKRVLWEEKRREDELRALDIRVVRIVDDDLDRWAPVEVRLRALLAQPGAPRRDFTAAPRTRGVRRSA